MIPDATGSAKTDIVGGYRVTEGRHIVHAVRNGMESDLEAIACCVWKPSVCACAHVCLSQMSADGYTFLTGSNDCNVLVYPMQVNPLQHHAIIHPPAHTAVLR